MVMLALLTGLTIASADGTQNMTMFSGHDRRNQSCIVFPATECVSPGGSELLNVSVSAIADCCDLCDNTLACRGWTFTGGICYLKSRCPWTRWPSVPSSIAGVASLPPVPSLPGRCEKNQMQSHGWPRFETKADLSASNWAAYFHAIYGAVPAMGYPICIWDFWYLDQRSYVNAGISGHAMIAVSDWAHRRSAVNIGDLYYVNVTKRGTGTYKNGLWIAHSNRGYGRAGYGFAANNTWIEVRHQSGLMTGDVGGTVGMWLLYAPGSGVWFNTGRTRVFETHAVALWELCGHHRMEDDVTEMVRCARLGGELDSFQIQDDWDIPEYVELVAVNLDGSFPCGAAEGGTLSMFRSGWLASNPCHCKNDVQGGWLNCKQQAEYHSTLPFIMISSTKALGAGCVLSVLWRRWWRGTLWLWLHGELIASAGEQLL
eukprot:TRINITY_DN13731_c0_g1_i1.p1 TRINITY_DN13731_c0_g1~~TRINITY_DN13731_c0_g1_i1.p1  ORF type:complete len:429 (-),score=39.04 TRINITY_DN13731_c0_g1_i1:220-1506(-)